MQTTDSHARYMAVPAHLSGLTASALYTGPGRRRPWAP